MRAAHRRSTEDQTACPDDPKRRKPATEAEAEAIMTKALLEVVVKMAPRWDCEVCRNRFINYPGGEPPFATKFAYDPDGNRVVESHICRRCFYK